MAERIVSPAVFTNEIDSTFLVEGISAIGGAIVGPFTKGPAYSPTVVTSINELEALFGVPQGIYYQPFTAREYLLQQGVVTIVRTGAMEGWYNLQALAIKAEYVSGSIDSADVAEGDVPQEAVIGVLANTLKEKTDTGELILKENLASPRETSIGFYGSYLEDASGNQVTELELSADTLTGQLVLRQVFNEQDSATSNNVLEPTELGSFRFSIDPSSPDSLQNIFGRAPQRNVKPAYFESYFESTQSLIHDLVVNHGAKYKITIELSDDFLNFSSQLEDADGDGFPNYQDSDYQYPAYDGAGKGEHACRPAKTPYIMSQEISGSRYELFRFCTRSFGQASNREVKVGIFNVKTPGTLDGTEYGSFSIVVRGFGDNDKTQDVIEEFRDVTLDPLSPRYLPRVVGDRYTYINEMGKIIERGDYANGSDWIRVEMPKDSIAPTQCMPYGHAAYQCPIGELDLPEPKYAYSSQYSRVSKRYFCGAVFNEDSPDGVLKLPEWSKDTLELFSPIPENAGFAGMGFFMDQPGTIEKDIDGVIETETFEPIPSVPSSASAEADARGHRRFLVGFQGGEDGHSPVLPILLGDDIRADNVQGMDCSKRFSPGTQGYERAFKALSNQDEFDINLLVTPGLTLDLHRSVINMGVDLCETREDCFYILDCVQANGQPGLVDEAVMQASTIDSNYAATYYPWVKIIDPATNALQPFPPSAVMPAVYAANDKTAAEWFAPAGLNRGGLEGAVSVMDRLTFAERDTLYEGKVNPIAQFPGQGIVAFGQKTLQRRASALDRINVRRLLITLKKFIASTSRYLLFEQNTAATRNKFLAIVNPYLEAVQQRQGLYAFNVIMDESNNTPDLIDRNILYGQIFLQPARAVEFIILDFNLQATGATFG
tara:strand:+ start:1655 stop:4312 length:2658 start_codon:yes stop_codon:yes gene_type:complete